MLPGPFFARNDRIRNQNITLMTESNFSRSLKFAAIPTVIVLFLAVYPQLNLWMATGKMDSGAYYVSNYDEVAYSAYVNSLIAERPRTNDPFTGNDHAAGESLYSIQFIPAYAIAWPARVLGIPAATAFLILNFLLPILSVLALFFLIRSVTGDDLVAAVGSGAVLCLGTAVAFQGELRELVSGGALIHFFPFLRRYQPGLAFPLFFLFCTTAWKMFTAEKRSNGFGYAVAAGSLFAVLVFSYFYLWTAAAAWFGCLSVFWVVSRKMERVRTFERIAIVAVFGLAAIGGFFWLLSNRSENTDSAQLLTQTRMPDLFALPEVIGILIALAVAYLIWRGKLELGSRQALMTLSFAVTPLILFNQQIVTGRSLQPVHYEIFIANYLVVTSAVLLAGLTMHAESVKATMRRSLVYVGIIAAVWGLVEAATTANKYNPGERLRVAAMPALEYLRSQDAEPNGGGRYPAVLSSDLTVADFVPTVTNFRPLWNPHANSAGGVSISENKELFFRFLYFSGFSPKDLAEALNGNSFEVKAALFGGGRALSALDSGAEAVTASEMQDEVSKYQAYIAAFSSQQASDPAIAYAIFPAENETDLSRLDKWYVRDAGTVFGAFKVFKLTSRQPQ